MFRMFPKYCCCDTMFGTNNKKRELFTLAFLEGINTAFNCGRAFVPNGQAWVFDLLFKHCLPKFWGANVCSRVRLMITDGCSQEYLSFINNTGKENTFPNAIHGLCNYHLLNKGYQTHLKGHFFASKFNILQSLTSFSCSLY